MLRGTTPELMKRMKAAVDAHRHGRLSEAIAGYRAVTAQRPGFAEAHNNLAAALLAAGSPPEAARSARRAIAARPDYALAHATLANALAASGAISESVGHRIKAVRLAPERQDFRLALAEALRPMRFESTSPAVDAAIELCLQSPGIETQALLPAALSALRQRPALRRALQAKPGERFSLDELAGETTLECLLTQGILADPAFEAVLTALRRDLLQRCRAGEQIDHHRLIAALACQCHATDYAYPVSEEERASLASLTARHPPDGGGPLDEAGLVAALYGPPEPLEAAPGEPETLTLLRRRTLEQPREERRLAETLASLNANLDEVSDRVQQQYEEHPYPRWLTTVERPSRPLNEVLRQLFPHLGDLPGWARPRVLVAGCGTGKHAIDVATRYQGSRVTAIDLSRASLGYALREARERGLAQIEFARADIMALEGWEQRFDLIESVGVLHHLADPVAGWRILVGLLAPGGVMKIGLYSTRARRAIEAARAWLSERGFRADDDGLREARQALLALPAQAAERGVLDELDFYSLSGCRDLLFNVQERTYDLLEIAGILEELGLEFLGFEHPDANLARGYRQAFPADRAMTDLASWDTFEQERPQSFRTMYQFWCRPKGTAGGFASPA